MTIEGLRHELAGWSTQQSSLLMSGYRVPHLALESWLSSHTGLQDLYSIQLIGRCAQRIDGEHGEVGPFARCQASQPVLLEGGVSCTKRVPAEGFDCGDRFFR